VRLLERDSMEMNPSKLQKKRRIREKKIREKERRKVNKDLKKEKE
jgi:hypothetical protein